MEGHSGLMKPHSEYPKVSSETLMGEGVALRGLQQKKKGSSSAFGRSGAFGARGTSAPHAMFSSCALHVTRVCSLAAVLRAFGRAGAFGARWHLHRHAIVPSRAVQSRASARSQALDATCVSRKNYVSMGTPHFLGAKFQLILQVFPTT
jgi:hypothetical protein